MEYIDQFCYLMLHWQYAKGFMFGMIIFPMLPLFCQALIDFVVLFVKFFVGFLEDLKK